MPAESRLIWRFFEVVTERNPPTKPHPDVKCGCCGQFFRNAQLGRDVLQHAGYHCPSAVTDMVDMARRIIFQKACRKADKGDRSAQLKVMLGEAGEPSWKRRNEHNHPWLSGYVSGESDEDDDHAPPKKKKPRLAKAAADDASLKEKTADEQSKGKANENELILAIAEAFNSAGIPYSTIDTAPFHKLIKLCNPKLTIPTSEELQKALPQPRRAESKGTQAIALVGDREAVC